MCDTTFKFPDKNHLTIFETNAFVKKKNGGEIWPKRMWFVTHLASKDTQLYEQGSLVTGLWIHQERKREGGWGGGLSFNSWNSCAIKGIGRQRKMRNLTHYCKPLWNSIWINISKRQIFLKGKNRPCDAPVSTIIVGLCDTTKICIEIKAIDCTKAFYTVLY